MKRFSAIILLVLLATFSANAWHIIGGELYYTCLGNNNYKITLKVYRDCNSTTLFDNPASITIYNSNHIILQTISIGFPGSVGIPPDLSNPCLQLPPGICVEEAVYEATVNLPPTPGGYDLSYQRCCRNSSIVNILDPENTGATFTAHIPDATLAGCNSSPRFTNYPPIVICVNEQLTFDHSATDPDGDELQYSLCTPYQGADATTPQPVPAPPPPYDPIIWLPPYNLNNQIGGVTPLSIDPNTGLLTAFPTTLGQFVVGICVKEYKNGVLLSTNIRDFQFNITTCNPLIEANFTATNTVNTDTLLFCGTNTVIFDNLSYGSNFFQWDFGVPGITTDVSSASDPTYTYPDTGVFKVMLAASPGLTCGDTMYKYVEIRKGITADFEVENGCALTPLSFTDLSTPLDGYVSAWNWDYGDGNSSTSQNGSHSYSTGGSYNVTLTVHNNYGCSSSVVKPVIIYSLPVINAQTDTFICDVDDVQLSSGGGTSYQWTPDYNLSNASSPNPVASPDVSTVYTVTVIDANGCSNSDSVTVMVTDTVMADVSGSTTLCEGDTTQLFASNGVYYEWTPSDGLSSTVVADPLASPNQTITYYVTSYIGSCFDIDTVTITVLPKPVADAGPDATINQGESVQLNATGGDNYQWSPPDGLNDPFIPGPIASPLNTTKYAVSVSYANGCASIDSVTVNVTHFHLIIVPNAFTPNGDGVNDQFQFYTKGIQEISSIKIFNRWGQMIYSSQSSEEAWDGTYKGASCELGVYAYDITGITYDGDVIRETGSVTLLK